MTGENNQPNGPTKGPPRQQRSTLPIAMAFIALLLLILYFTNSSKSDTLSWTGMLEKIRAGEVTRYDAGVVNATVFVMEEDKTEVDYLVKYPYGLAPNLGEMDRQLQEAFEAAKRDHGREVVVKGDQLPGMWSGLLPQFIFFVFILFLLYFFVFRRMGQGGGVLSFGKSRATLVGKGGKTSKNFKDVAGIDEAKEEVEELVDFLRNPKKFQKLGGRIPKGVLLVGPPGTGKTLLARAIAGEADVPFYSISGSDFVEMFVGVGASRVRDLFQQAKDNSPCIIFIDEIDAVARRRGSGFSSGGHDEREQTLNAILVEMDGFASNDKVIVIAATNRVDVLDPALLRPGRFDRHIHVDLPDINGREQILQVHGTKVKLGEDADLSIVARGTPGFSGADLENLINEAALNAARRAHNCVHQSDLEYARDRVAFGREKKTGSKAVPEDERRMTAYHEAGHALVQQLLPEVDELHKVTIIPRRGMGGATFFLPDDRRSLSRKKMLGMICGLMGGRIAEARFCGDITTGAKADINQATGIARSMIVEYGMSEKMGAVRYTRDVVGFAGNDEALEVADETKRELDEELRRILYEQTRRCEEIISKHHDIMVALSDALLDYETLSAEQVRTIIDGGTLEPRVPTVQLKRPNLQKIDGSNPNASDDGSGAEGLTPGLV